MRALSRQQINALRFCALPAGMLRSRPPAGIEVPSMRTLRSLIAHKLATTTPTTSMVVLTEHGRRVLAIHNPPPRRYRVCRMCGRAVVASVLGPGVYVHATDPATPHNVEGIDEREVTR